MSWEQSLAELAVLAASLAALYARWSVREAKQSNDIVGLAPPLQSQHQRIMHLAPASLLHCTARGSLDVSNSTFKIGG